MRRLATLLGHDIELRSRIGRGSAFGVWATRAAGLATVERHAAPDVAVTPLQGRNVVVVDDEAPVREGMENLLSQWRSIRRSSEWPVTASAC